MINVNVLAQNSIRKLVLVPYWLVMENVEKAFHPHFSASFYFSLVL